MTTEQRAEQAHEHLDRAAEALGDDPELAEIRRVLDDLRLAVAEFWAAP